MKYLIMECQELGDQYECDANRIPITMTDNWQKWYENTKPNYLFEVYEFIDNHFYCIKNYETPIEKGMCFAYWHDEDETPIFIKKFPNFDRYTTVPEEIKAEAKKGTDYEDRLYYEGYLSWFVGEDLYCYAEYEDNEVVACCY